MRRGGRAVRSIGLFLLLLAVWLLWSGIYKPLLIGLGVVSCILCVWIARRMHDAEAERFRFGSMLRAIGYFPWLIKEIAVANWSVIRLILAPRPAIDPVMVTLESSQTTDLGRVVYGNSITLTPGTLTVDVENQHLTVHVLTRAGAKQLQGGEMDARVTALEGGR